MPKWGHSSDGGWNTKDEIFDDLLELLKYEVSDVRYELEGAIRGCLIDAHNTPQLIDKLDGITHSFRKITQRMQDRCQEEGYESYDEEDDG